MTDDSPKLSPEEQARYDLEEYLEDQRMLHDPEFQRRLLQAIEDSLQNPPVSNWRELFED